MKTAVSVPDTLFAAAERMAKRLGVSRSELYQRALRSYLNRHRDDAVTEALNEVYVSDSGAEGLDPGLAAMQAATLEPSEWE